MKKASTFFLVTFMVTSSFAQEECDQLPNDQLLMLRNTLTEASLPLINNANGENDQWRSVGALRIQGAGHCTATLIEPPGECAFHPDQEAMILTSGHCRDPLSSSVHRGPAPEPASVTFNYFHDTVANHIPVPVKEVVYSTMTKRDVGIMKLGATYRQLAELGLVPRKISRSRSSGTLFNPAIPVLSVDPKFLRGTSCDFRGNTSNIEGSNVWPDQIRVNCPAWGGSSGSGLFNSSGELNGIINTTNDFAGRPHITCGSNLPCEYAGGMIQPQSELPATYGVDVSFLHSCFSAQCSFTADAPACDMPTETPVSIRLSSPTNNPVLNFQEQGYRAVKYKTGAPGINCADPTGYTVSETPAQPIPLTVQSDGHHVVCVLGQKEDGSWTIPNNVRQRAFEVDRVPPVTIASPVENKKVKIMAMDGSVVRGAFKYARTREECSSPVGFRPPFPPEERFGISVVDVELPFVCLKATDRAGNEGSAIAIPTTRTESE